MQRSLVIDCLEKIGKEVELEGWVVTVRSHGKIGFFDLRDMSGIIQVGGFGKELADKIAGLGTQDAVRITGLVKQREKRYINENIPTGTIELELKTVEVMAKAEEMPFDMAGKELHVELPTLLDYRSLTLRHTTVYPIFQLQAEIIKAFREISEKLGCTEIFIPTIVASSTEGGAEVFSVDYYGHNAYMSQSPQLYKQMMVPVFERVYTIAHAYRAEPSVTTRHLSESTQMDCEFGFVEFEQLLDLLEEVGTYVLKTVNARCREQLALYGVKDIALGKIPRLTLREAQEIIFKETGRDQRSEKDMAPQDEVDICTWALKNHGSDLVTITHFPAKTKPFYTMPDPKDPEYSLSYDLLFRGVEVLSGSQRVNDYKRLLAAIKARGMNPKSFGMYLQAFQYGMPPEGGFSFGLERITQKMLHLENVRQASLFPRDMERVDERFSKTDETKTANPAVKK